MHVRRIVLPALAFGFVAAAAVSVAALDGGVTGPATSGQLAARVPVVGDVASISNVGTLAPEVELAAVDAARAVGAVAVTGRSASIGAVQIVRGSAVVQAPPAGMRTPFTVTALPQVAIADLMGRDLSGLLGPSTVVMGSTTADLRGARAGDAIDLVAADGSIQRVTIGAVAEDARIGGTELVMNLEAADRLGITTPTRVVVWGIGSRSAFEAAVAVRGLTTRKETRVSTSWDPPNPDSTLGTARTKAVLGEFAYTPPETGDVFVQEEAWKVTNLPPNRVLLSTNVPINARCHNRIAADLQAALDEVAAAGLGGEIELANTNTYGGCYNPRYNRINGELGVISRHAWAQAIDMNTVSNCQGCRPQMNCDVVRIFRKHGFAWGGNFLRPDGMHFEWVGEPRDQVQGPSRYCPNAGQPLIESIDGQAMTGDSFATLFADDPLAASLD